MAIQRTSETDEFVPLSAVLAGQWLGSNCLPPAMPLDSGKRIGDTSNPVPVQLPTACQASPVKVPT